MGSQFGRSRPFAFGHTQCITAPMTRLSLLAASLSFLAAACAPSPGQEDAGPDADAGSIQDAGAVGDAGAGRGDAGTDEDGGPPAPPLVDAGPDHTLDGTPFADVAVLWSAPLTLCNSWREGAPLADERARKARVVVPAQARASLGELHLAQARVDGVTLARGVEQADRFAPAAVTTELSSWEVAEPSTTVSSYVLTAELAHDLGPAGVLREQLSVWRADDDDTAVRYHGGDAWEVTWALEPPDAESIFLTPCAGTGVFDAAEVLVAEDDAGRQLVVTRWLRTADTLAGSFPVHWLATDVSWADEAWRGQRLFGFFSHTYSAQHHNWAEQSLIEPLRDPAGFHAGGPFVRVALKDLRDGLLQGSVELTEPGTDGGPDVVTELDAVGDWRRVDARAWTIQGALTCAGGAVRSAALSGLSGVPDYGFQLLTCPGSSPLGFDLVGLVPFAFGHAATSIGELSDGDAVQPITDGFEVDLGAAGSVLVTSAPSAEDVIVEVRDADGVSQTMFLTALGTFGHPSPPDETLRGASADGAVSFLLRRRWAAQGVGESAVYAPLSFELAFADERHVVSGFDVLDYTNTHHNWNDALVADSGETTLTWSVTYEQGPLVYRVKASRGGVDVLPETVVELE